MKRIWRIIKILFYMILAVIMVTVLIMSFFDTPDVPEFVWEMPRVY